MPTELAVQSLPSVLAILAAITIPVILMGATLTLARIEARNATQKPRR